MDKLKIVKIIRETYINYISFLTYAIRKGFPIDATTRAGRNSKISYLGDIVSDYLNIKYGIDFYYDKEIWTDPAAVFVNNDYSYLSGGNVVLDIGANIGDSPIYFIINGARRVIAVEPFPQNFNLLVKNIEFNKLRDMVIPINAMIGKENKQVFLNTDREITTGIQAHPSDVGAQSQMVTLSELMNRYGVNEAYLKMDCEGCEYESILAEDKATLRKFSRIQIEYHYGSKELVEKLKKSGFLVTSTKPIRSFNRCAANPNMLIGYIYAQRVTER